MGSYWDTDKISHASASSRQQSSWQQGTFWVRPTATLLPYFEEEIPLLIGSKGHHMVPIALLCRFLSLDATSAIHLSRNKLLWSSPELLPVRRQQGRHKPAFLAFAWCLDYPLAVGYWLSFVYQRIHDPVRRDQARRFMDDAAELSGMAFDLVHAKYVAGRQGMYSLVTDLARLEEVQREIERHIENSTASAHIGETLHTQATRWLENSRIFLQPAQSFVHTWTEKQRDQIIVDAIHLDAEGHRVGDPEPFAPLATFSNDQQRQLRQAQEECARLTGEGQSLLQAYADEQT